MRADLAVRYYWQDESRADGPVLGLGWRARDGRSELGVPAAASTGFPSQRRASLLEDANGTQLGSDWDAHFTIGYRF